jgi:uncharacterized repeat protein (TIGR01451 family)
MRAFRCTLSIVLAISVLGAFSSAALASGSAPGWGVITRFSPTNLPPGGEGTITIYLYNIGGAPAPNVTIVDTLPKGVTAIASEATEGFKPTAGCSNQSANVVICKPIGENLEPGSPSEIQPGGMVQNDSEILIPVKIESGLEGTGVNTVTVSGGGAAEAVTRSTPVTFSARVPGFGFASLNAWFSNANGTIDTQAGSHPYEFTIAFAMNSEHSFTPFGEFEERSAGGEIKHINVELPAGMVGDAHAVPECTIEEFESSTGEPGCPPDTQVGEDIANVGSVLDEQHVFNMVPPPGVVAQFAFRTSSAITFLNAGIRTGGDSGLDQHTTDLPEKNIVFNSTTIWGVPSEESHDPHRRCTTCTENISPTQLLTMPTACSGPLTFGIEASGTYQDEAARASTSAVTRDNNGNPVGIGGCELLGPFTPSVTIAPDTSEADTPAGLTAEVSFPNADLRSLVDVEALASPSLKDTTVTLPQGVVVNPGQATGLVACPPADVPIGIEGPGTEDPATCPSASKIGEVEVETPLLANRLKGGVYILPSNPPNLQILATPSGEGLNFKLVGNVHLNETTGQLVATFKETPEIPFSHFKLSFSGGAQAALVTPTACGAYTSTTDFTPWNSPQAPDFPESDTFQITSAPGGAPCEDPLPFAPSLIAGATTDQAGGYTNFSVLLQRPDGQQRIKSLQFKTPAGLLGMISKVPLCPEPQAAEGTCSAASQIGHTVVGAGPGPYPLFIPEAGQPPAPIYLTGGYDGAPYGLSIVVPIVAGPFTLETQVVRAKIEVDPLTAQLTITTSPLPTIVDGIPADLRSINAVIDRPGFMFNPTNCSPMSFSGTATSTEGATASLGSHFQMGSCQALKFSPNFKVSTSAKTSKADGASLTAKIVYPTGELGANQASSQANIASVKVELPKQLPSRLTTLQKACTAAQFEANPAGCPADSVVGHATVDTPVVPVPLTGPAYFVSHGGEAFPSLIVVLQGYGVTIHLVGTTFISSKGITSSTFKQVPDVPIGSFELILPEGPYSALAATLPASAKGSLCASKLTMPTAFVAQNGAVLNQATPITVTGCGKSKTKTKTLTRAQKLTRALKACGRAKAKHTRTSCERHAHEKYAPTKRTKGK